MRPFACLLAFGALYLVQDVAEIRNFAGEPVDFYWMDVGNWGNYIKQTKKSLVNASSAPLKTYETHRFFVAWADEADEVHSWDADLIPQHLQFVHRGYDQVITARVDSDGSLYLEDFDIHEGEVMTLTKDIEDCAGLADEDAYTDCVYEAGRGTVERLEREVAFMENHNKNVRERLATSFCGDGKFHSPPLRSFTFGGRPHVVGVDVLLDNDDVAIYHLKGMLDDETIQAFESEGPGEDERQKDVMPPSTSGGLFSREDPLRSLSKRVDAFAKDKLKLKDQLGDTAQPFHIFRYGEKEIHVPPCDGICQRMQRDPSEYAVTFIAYIKVSDVGGGQWRFTSADNQTVGFLPQPKDAVVFHWKTQGYKYDLLPKLTPCQVLGENSTMITASKWLPTAAAAASQDKTPVATERLTPRATPVVPKLVGGSDEF